MPEKTSAKEGRFLYISHSLAVSLRHEVIAPTIIAGSSPPASPSFPLSSIDSCKALNKKMRCMCEIKFGRFPDLGRVGG